MNHSHLRAITTLLCLMLTVVGGCNSVEPASENDGHGHSHDHAQSAKSLHGAIVELRSIWTAISTAMDNNDPDAAHDPLHDVGRLLESLPDLAAETDLKESAWNEIKAEADRLFEAFAEIDAAFHTADGEKVKAYDSAKSTIDKGVAALEAKLPMLGEESSSDDEHHEHENDDHGGDDQEEQDEHGHDESATGE